jgi:glutaredoxin
MTVKMYTPSTCGHFRAAKQFLGEHAVAHELTY